VAAARRLRAKGVVARFVLAGRCDASNPAAIDREQLRQWARDGVEWWEHRDDMPAVFAAASLVVLPTYYREGLPKVLLEASASGRPIIATDVPGCRDIVRHRVTGVLVPARDAEALSNAIEELLNDSELRCAMGRHGRAIAVNEYSVDVITGQVLAFYRDLLHPQGARLPAEGTA
jgi:glycosyltransferase involved in cell wall biosynthesis